jgi:hypothetical protein
LSFVIFRLRFWKKQVDHEQQHFSIIIIIIMKKTDVNMQKDKAKEKEEEKKQDVDLTVFGAHPSAGLVAPPPPHSPGIEDMICITTTADSAGACSTPLLVLAETAVLRDAIAVQATSRDAAFFAIQSLRKKTVDLQLALQAAHGATIATAYASRQARVEYQNVCDIYYLRQIKAREHPSHETRQKVDDARDAQKMAIKTVLETHHLFLQATEKEHVARAAHDQNRLEHWTAIASYDQMMHDFVLATVDLHLLENPDDGNLEQQHHHHYHDTDNTSLEDDNSGSDSGSDSDSDYNGDGEESDM